LYTFIIKGKNRSTAGMDASDKPYTQTHMRIS